MFDLDKSGVTEMPDAYIEFRDWLESYTKELVEFTVVKLRDHHYMPEVASRHYIRDLAKTMKRPDIFYTGVDNITLDMPRRKYLEQIMAPLNLIGMPIKSHWHIHAPGVYIDMDTTRIRFKFLGKKELFNEWLLKTRTNPEWRKAIGLPSE